MTLANQLCLRCGHFRHSAIRRPTCSWRFNCHAAAAHDIDTLKQLVAAKDARIAILEEQLRFAAVRAYAPKSEKLASLAQFDLFNEAELLAGASDAHSASAPCAAEVEVPAHTRERGKRKPIDATLPRQRIEHDIPDAEKTCACGCQLTRIGEVTSE